MKSKRKPCYPNVDEIIHDRTMININQDMNHLYGMN